MTATTLRRFLSLAALCLCAGLAHAAGFGFIEVPADKNGPMLRGAVWTPCDLPAGKISVDLLDMDATRNCPVSGTRLPLVVVSHGRGGSALTHHDTAAALADAGFVVAAISHPGDNFQDASGQGHLSIYATRPADMKRLVDYMLGRWAGNAALDANRVGLFGFSMGGYTGLASVGAVPDFKLVETLCATSSTVPLCGEIRRNELPKVPPRDERIKAAVIVDPLSIVFDAGDLKTVTLPIQLWASAFGGDGIVPRDVEKLHRALPVEPEWHRVPDAAHFAFVAPCTLAMARDFPEICNDGPGFDRVAFHRDFNAQVLAFFRAHLGSPEKHL